MSGQLGMWQPTRKDGRNWKVTFSVTTVATGDVVTDRVKHFRVRADAYDWVNLIKTRTVEANQIKKPPFKDFTYKISKTGDS